MFFFKVRNDGRRPDDFKAVALDIEETSNILFSSGTTGANAEV